MKQGKPYLELVASILYASTMTRPDIAYHMSMLYRFLHNPPVDCYSRAEELLNYLYSTKDWSSCLAARNSLCPTSTPCATLEQRRSALVLPALTLRGGLLVSGQAITGVPDPASPTNATSKACSNA
eukprot:2363182-Pleurochrysis_carterae.AAC.1